MKDSTETLQCDICGLEVHFNSIFHFSGTLDGSLSGHIHVCWICTKHLDLYKVMINVDELKKEVT